jgi:hypothetical protein
MFGSGTMLGVDTQDMKYNLRRAPRKESTSEQGYNKEE